ncbi:DUF1419 domain-containing protein [Rhizobium sp. BR 318]|uniref:DUF1419 domain-containing protein n=1 Tax=unclassified Rhizobium TaxID=2613769 RepID=UPI002F3EB6B3
MNPYPAIRKVFQGVPSRPQMFRMFDRHLQRPNRWGDDATPLYDGEWFEILPPLWICGSMFAMREFLTGSVTSVFFALRIDEAIRYFHGYCDLSEKASVETMRLPIIERENRPVRVLTRAERLEHIWSSTADDFRGYADERWPEASRGKRTVMIYGGKDGTVLKLLEGLSDDETAAKLPVQLRHLPSPIAA